MLGQKKIKYYRCLACGIEFSNLDGTRVCSNCFACTGCEIYNCPFCEAEVVVKPMKQSTPRKQ